MTLYFNNNRFKLDNKAYYDERQLAEISTIAQTIYVATTGSDITGDGTSGNPYATRQKAYDSLPSIINSRIIIDIAAGTYTDSATFPSLTITPSGSVTIRGAYARSALLTCTGGTDVDGNGRSNFVVAGAGWVVDEHKGKMIEVITQDGPASSIDSRFIPIHSNTADTLVAPPLFWTPGVTTTFYIISPLTIINTSGNDAEVISKSNVDSNIYTSGLYYNYKIQYETLKFVDFEYAFYNNGGFINTSGIWFNRVGSYSSPAYFTRANGRTYSNGIYCDGIFNNVSSSLEWSSEFFGYYIAIYSGYTGGDHIYGHSVGNNSMCYAYCFLAEGSLAKRINSVIIANGYNAVGNIYQARIDYANNVMRSLNGGFVSSAVANSLYGGSNIQKLFNIKTAGKGSYSSQSNLTYTTAIDVDDSGEITAYSSAYDEYETISGSLYNINAIATSTIGPARKLQSITTASAITLISTPTITAGSILGEEIELVGTSDTNTVTLQDNSVLSGSNLILSGISKTRTLKNNERIKFRWTNVSGTNRWKEITNAIIGASSSETIADDSYLDIPNNSYGFGMVMIGDNEEYARFRFSSNGTVTILEQTTNVDSNDTDGNLCIYDNGTNVRIKNRLGSSKILKYYLTY